MSAELIIAFIARDRPGVVQQLSAVVISKGGNWLESRMSQLADTFAGVARINIDERAIADLRSDLLSLNEDGFEITVQKGGATAHSGFGATMTLNIIGPDSPGIVHAITKTMAGLGASVEDMETRVESAPVSGEPQFHAEAAVRLPDGLSEEAFTDAVEDSAQALFVDITVRD